VEDDISWKLTPNGQYTTKSAYELHFIGSTISPMYKTIWKSMGTTKGEFFCMACQPRKDLDGRPVGQARVAKLWALSSLQTIHGIYRPPLRPLPLHHPNLGPP
jgi:hypothetical protein